MHLITLKSLLLLIIFELSLILFIGYNYIILLNLFNSIILILYSVPKLINNIKAIYIALVGFAVLSFLDTFKFYYILDNDFNLDKYYHQITIYWLYISLILFMSTYLITSLTFKIKQNTPYEYSHKKLLYIFVPISFLVSIIQFVLPSGALETLVGFLPKSVVVVLLYFSLIQKRNRYKYLFISILLLLFMHEHSRRIFIVGIFTFLAIIISLWKYKYGKIKIKHKIVIIIIMIFGFVLMSYLRSDNKNLEGYQEGNTFHNTIIHMEQLKSIDTFDNSAFVIKNFPDVYDYYYGKTYFAIFVQFIPRTFWQDKPVSFGAPLGLLRKAGIRDFDKKAWKAIGSHSYSPGFIGEAYANFGFIGIIFMSILFGFLTKVYDRTIYVENVLKNINILPYLPFLGSFFLILRGDLLMATYFSILFFIFIKLVLFGIKK